MNSCHKPANVIVIITAMEEEAKPLISKLQMSITNVSLTEFQSKLGLQFFGCEINCKKVYLIHTGKNSIHEVDNVGIVPAALTASVAIESLHPDLIISAGTAGGLNDSQIGDVYVSNSPFCYCDRVINLPKFLEYGEGHYNFHSVNHIAKSLEIKLGKVATSHSLDPSERDPIVLRKLKAEIVDMESAAIANVAQIAGTKMIAVKSVTNYLDRQLHSDFLANYQIAVDNLAEKLFYLIPALL